MLKRRLNENGGNRWTSMITCCFLSDTRFRWRGRQPPSGRRADMQLFILASGNASQKPKYLSEWKRDLHFVHCVACTQYQL